MKKSRVPLTNEMIHLPLDYIVFLGNISKLLPKIKDVLSILSILPIYVLI